MEQIKKTFREYMEKICFELNPAVFDDDMSDFFDKWLNELDGEDYMTWAELYGREMYLDGKETILDREYLK